MEEFEFASKEEDIVYFFQGVTDNGCIANINTNPKKGLMGGINNVLIIQILKEIFGLKPYLIIVIGLIITIVETSRMKMWHFHFLVSVHRNAISKEMRL